MMFSVNRVLVLASIAGFSLSMLGNEFTRDSICNLVDRLAEGCMREVPGASSVLQCALECHQDDMCVGISINSLGRVCHIHEICVSEFSCTSYNEEAEFWSKYCVHGHWNHTTQSCQCAMGTMGSRCDVYPESCNDLIFAGMPKGEYRVILDLHGDHNSLLKAVCQIDPTEMTHSVGVIANNGKLDANRTWNEYNYGFYTDTRNYFLGFRAWHLLSGYGFSFSIFTLNLKSGSTNSVSCKYDDFYLTETEGMVSYSHVSCYADPAESVLRFGDCLANALTMPFSTKDADSDGVPDINCASVDGSGWWYPGDCSRLCNMMAWGLDNWHALPSGQRFDLVDLDVASLVEEIDYFQVVIKLFDL